MRKILLIEDDLNLLEMYQEEFMQNGFIVDVASNGWDGLTKMKAFQPDIVLLDMVMPYINGFEVLKKSEYDPDLKKIPIIILTNVSTDVGKLVSNWNVLAYLLKVEYTPDKIVDKVEEILSSLTKS